MMTHKALIPLKSALGENFRPGIAADRFTPAPSLKKEATPTTMTSDAHSGDNVIADINPATGVAVRIYVTPTLDGNISMTDIGASTYYYNSDERQSVKNLTDSSAAVAQSYGYTAYGDKVDSLTNGTVTQRYQYTGRELNEVSGDYYFRYRMYGAYLGGFLSRDPLGYIDGMSVYSGWFATWVATDAMGTLTMIDGDLLLKCMKKRDDCGKKCTAKNGSEKVQCYKDCGKGFERCVEEIPDYPVNKEPKDFNCAGLAFQTWENEPEVKVEMWLKGCKEVACDGECPKGKVKMWYFNWHWKTYILPDEKTVHKEGDEFHIVAQPCDCTDCYSKNGGRPIEGPVDPGATGPSPITIIPMPDGSKQKIVRDNVKPTCYECSIPYLNVIKK